MRKVTFLLCLCMLAIQTVADPFSITNISSPDTNGIILLWENVTDRYIVAQSPSLTTGQFQYVGNVLSSNSTVVSNIASMGFYRIREVAVVQFLDPNFRRAVSNAIPLKYSPTNWIYDVDVEPITNLNASIQSISNATGIEALTGIRSLDLRSNSLSQLDVSACINLQALYCGYNLTNLNVSGCTNLQTLDCTGNRLTNLEVSACVVLQALYCGHNRLTNLNVSACTNLQTLHCEGNRLTNLNVSACGSLQALYCGLTLYSYGNFLSDLDLSACTNLRALDCSYNQLTNLDLSACTNLVDLWCSSNGLEILNISSNKALTSVDARKNPALTNVVVWWNPPGSTNWLLCSNTVTYSYSP